MLVTRQREKNMCVLPRNDRTRRFGQRSAMVLLSAAGLATGWLLLNAQTGLARRPYGGGDIEYEFKSDFSRIRVRKQGSHSHAALCRPIRRRSRGVRVDLDQPHQLLVPYSRTMFASYLFNRTQQRVMIVGLGGGSMVHFLKHYAPKLQIDVVEIDPAIVRVADEYFGIRAAAT